MRKILDKFNIDYTKDRNEFCEPCMEGKQHRMPFSSSEKKVDSPCSIISADLGGPMEIESLGKSRYFLLLKDHYSHYRTVFFIKYKSEVAEKLKIFFAGAKADIGQKIKVLNRQRARIRKRGNQEDATKIRYSTSENSELYSGAKRGNRMRNENNS